MTHELVFDQIDLDKTLGCGQTFRWNRREDGSWVGPLGDQLVKLKSDGRRLVAEVWPGSRGFDNEVWSYFRGDDDLSSIQRELTRKDRSMRLGLKEMRGLRLVKMDPWECLASYVLATWANIPRIRKMIDSVAQRYGRRISDDVFAFPSRSQLSSANRAALRRCGLGYRADYLRSLARTVDEEDLRRMGREDHDGLRDELMEFRGVGPKVADCVSLFGFGKLEAFPIDVRVRRALARLYGIEGAYEVLRTFAASRFGGQAGYAQEYMYYNEGLVARGRPCAFTQQGDVKDLQ